MTYKQAFDKITTAYLNGKLEPWSNCACFIGNLLGGEHWAPARKESSCHPTLKFLGAQYIRAAGHDMYTPEEIFTMESNFLMVINDNLGCEESLRENEKFYPYYNGNPKCWMEGYEDALFSAMESTLEMLKQIHIAKGEVIDEEIPFTKRQLHESY